MIVVQSRSLEFTFSEDFGVSKDPSALKMDMYSNLVATET